jgi:hypothetical protein
MGTWLDDLRKNNPALAADYALVGNNQGASLRNMVKALSLFGGALNTPEDNARLAAAKRILKAQKRKG